MNWMKFLYSLVIFLSWNNSYAMNQEHLSPCPSSPNCVCSCDPGKKSYIPPFPLIPEGIERLKLIIEKEPRATIVESNDRYLHAEFRSKWFKFVDDVEFLVDPNGKVIDVRSKARSGYWDLGVNRRRIEKIRKQYLKFLHS